MDNKCTAQIFVGGAWRDAAVISLAGPEHQGWRTPTYTTYLPDYALDYLGRRDAAACGVRFPVSLEIDDQETWPAWLLAEPAATIRQLARPSRSQVLVRL